MPSDRTGEATCAVFVNTPTAPNYCNTATVYLGFPVPGFFEAANVLFIATVTFLQAQKKRKHESSQSASSCFFSTPGHERLWIMEGLHVYLFDIQKLHKQCIELGELGVCKGTPGKTVWTNFDRQATYCVLKRGKCTLCISNFNVMHFQDISRHITSYVAQLFI